MNKLWLSTSELGDSESIHRHAIVIMESMPFEILWTQMIITNKSTMELTQRN